LGQLNQMLHAAGWPPRSAGVALQATGEPRGGFWESSPNVPPAPSNSLARTGLYGQILAQVQAAP